MENKSQKKPIWKRLSFWIIMILFVIPMAYGILFVDKDELATKQETTKTLEDSLQVIKMQAERDSIQALERKAKRDSFYKAATPEERKIYDAQEKRRKEYESKRAERKEKEAKFEKRKKEMEEVFKNPVVFNSKLDGSVIQVKEYLKKNLNDPDSYQPVEWSPVSPNLESKSYIVVHKYRAKNGFGALTLYRKAFKLNLNGKVIEVNDF